MTDGEQWSAPGHRAGSFHSDPYSCTSVQQPDRYKQRSDAYIEWHELSPCPHCHDDLERPSGGNASGKMFATAVKEAANDD